MDALSLRSRSDRREALTDEVNSQPITRLRIGPPHAVADVHPTLGRFGPEIGSELLLCLHHWYQRISEGTKARQGVAGIFWYLRLL